MKRSHVVAVAIVAAAFAATFVACGGKKDDPKGTAGVSSASDGGSPTSTTAVSGDAGARLQPTVLAKVEYTEADFAENDRSRDPFRSFAVPIGGNEKKAIVNQRSVLLSQYSVDELKLVAIVMGGEYPRAMVLDPGNKGWIIKRGDFLGRAEVVHVGGSNGTDYQLNWRVDRIRDGDVVLIREDQGQPGIPPATRVITLHPEQDKAASGLERN